MRTFTGTIAVGSSLTCDVSDCDEIVVTLSGTWSGGVGFYGSINRFNVGGIYKRYGLNDSSNGNITTVAMYEEGASPSSEIKMYRGSVAGLTGFSLLTSLDVPFTGGTCNVTVTALEIGDD